MKLHSLITFLVLGAALAASAQTAAPRPPPQAKPASKTETAAAWALPDTSGQGALCELGVPACRLEEAVENLTSAYSKAALEKGSGGYQAPRLIYGPGAREAKIDAPLRLANLTDVRMVDALALVAAAAGCILDPIYSPPFDGDENQHIIGYCIALASRRPLNASSRTGSSTGGGESGGDDEVIYWGIGVNLMEKDGNIVVGDIIPDSNVDRSHALKPGDRIFKVADVDITGLPVQKVAEMLRGEPGSSVMLTISEHPEQRVSFLREKRKFRPGFFSDFQNPLLSHPKVAVLDVPYVTNFDGVQYVGHFDFTPDPATQDGKAGDPAKPPAPEAPPDETDSSLVRVYAVGSILSGNDQDMKEDGFTNLVKKAFDFAGLAKGAAPQLYFHMKSGVLIAKTTARGHKIIEQVVNALIANALRKSAEGVLQTIPPKP